MGLAIWRRKKVAERKRPASSVPGDGAAGTDPAGRNDVTAALRIRTRRRLIGAAALLLAAAILLPMVLDPAPRPVSSAIPIDIPSEKTPFAPRLALPPVPDPGVIPTPAAASAVSAEAADGSAAKAAESKAGEADADSAKKTGVPAPGKEEANRNETNKNETNKSEPNKSETKTASKASGGARKASDNRRESRTAKNGKFALQAAALGSESAAQELMERLSRAGLKPFTEKVETQEGPRFRVRLGPYATRQDAERERARLRALGVNANVVTT